MRKARVIAYYLPQFHPIQENDAVWGKGFTEWTSVAKAKPLFRGHNQPRIPADLGFYDLRIPEVREQQARLAREAGVEGFCYWHYWLGNGKLLLQRPFQEVLSSGKPDFPFCLCWANHSWLTSTWTNVKRKEEKTVIVEQTYPGEEDYKNHFLYCLPAFRDKRYITVDGKPVFGIFDPYAFPDMKRFIACWRKLAQENGLPGIFFYAITPSAGTLRYDAEGQLKRCIPNLESSAEAFHNILDFGFDAINSNGMQRAEMLYNGKYRDLIRRTIERFKDLPCRKYDYAKISKYLFAPEDAWENVFPTVYPQWDRTPRQGRRTQNVYVNSTPENFQRQLAKAVELTSSKEDEHKIVFLKAWNEWAEGDYVEPDLTYGHGFLDAIRNVILAK